jgi:hypothetical protein
MKLGRFSKDPNETKRYTIDYDAWLETGETLDTVTYEVTPVTASPLATAASSIAGDGRSVSVSVSGGLHGSDYKLTVTATTDTPQIKEDHINFSVRDQ